MSLGWTDDGCKAEQARLRARTKELNKRTRELADPERSFSAAEHAELKEDLRVHKEAVADFRRWCLAHDARPG